MSKISNLLNGAGAGNRLWIEGIGNNMYNVNFSLDSTINIQYYQFQLDDDIISIQKILYEPIDDFTSQQNYDLDSQHCEDPVWSGGKGGVFEPAGGLDPNIIAQFDINMIPKKWDMDKFMYYIDAIGIAWVDYNKEGIQLNPQHQTVMDMSIKTIEQYIVLLQSIMDEWEKEGKTYQMLKIKLYSFEVSRFGLGKEDEEGRTLKEAFDDLPFEN